MVANHSLSREPPLCRNAGPSSSPAHHSISPETTSTSTIRQWRYPNPGYLGASSHSTLFNQVLLGAETDSTSSLPPSLCSISISSAHPTWDQIVIDRAMCTLARLERIAISTITSLIRHWPASGVNLPLAGPFVINYLESVKQWIQFSGPRSGAGTPDVNSRSGVSSDVYVTNVTANT
jgi:hypothetical protein